MLLKVERTHAFCPFCGVGQPIPSPRPLEFDFICRVCFGRINVSWNADAIVILGLPNQLIEFKWTAKGWKANDGRLLGTHLSEDVIQGRVSPKPAADSTPTLSPAPERPNSFGGRSGKELRP